MYGAGRTIGEHARRPPALLAHAPSIARSPRPCPALVRRPPPPCPHAPGEHCSSSAAPSSSTPSTCRWSASRCPSIGADLDLTTSQLQWIVSAYVLGYGGFLLLGGRAADLLGRRRMFLISLAVFAARLRARRLRRRRFTPHRPALRQGRRRGLHRPGRALDHHDQLRGGPGAQPRHRHLHRDRRHRLLARAGDRRAADRDRLAVGLLRAGPDRAGHPDRRHQARARPRPRSGVPPLLRPGRRHRRSRRRCCSRCSPSSRPPTWAGRRRARSCRSPASPHCWPASWPSSGARRTRWCAWGSCARSRWCAPTSAPCRSSAAGSASSSSRPSTCRRSAAGPRSRPAWRSSPAGSWSRSWRPASGRW